MSKDTLSNALNSLRVAESRGQREVTLVPASKLLREVLAIFQQQGYVGEYELVEDEKSGRFRVRLEGRINRCGSVRPRSAVKAREWDRWEQRYLPSREVGLLVVSTSQGLMDHGAAKGKGLGGRLIAFCY
jgi:small subunit ribosomal protein S8